MKGEAGIKIIFFDGVCVMCGRFVDFILKNNPKENLYIATLQGIKAQEHLPTKDLQKINSLILMTDKELFYATDAVIEICRELRFPYSLGYYLQYVPRFVRNYVYYRLAANRYSVFGKLDQCRIPTDKEKKRFFN